MILYLVRHGQTAYNRDGRGLGREDVPLTPFGVEQAAAVAAAFAGRPIARILASPLSRAIETAAPIAAVHGLTVEPRSELLELDVGESEGLRYATIRERFPEFIAAWAGPDATLAAMPGGESLAELDQRLAPLLDELRTHPAEATLLATHNFVIKAAVCRLLGLPLASFRSIGSDVASITTLHLDKHSATLLHLNDICHLQPLSDAPPERSVG